jgi:hypothetical protein
MRSPTWSPDPIVRRISRSHRRGDAAKVGGCRLAQTQLRANAAASPSGLGLHLLLWEDAPAVYRNALRNYTEGRMGLIQGIAVRAD